MNTVRRTRMVDIATHCGVSKAAVVRALNRPVERSELRPETWSRIRTAAREMGYRADWRAQALAGGRSHTIGLLYDGIYPPLHGSPGRITAEVARWLAQDGYDLLLIPTDRDGWLAKIEDRRCDAAVVVGEIPAAVEIANDLPIPVVSINAHGRHDFPRVEPDDAAGAELAVRHLVDLGHRQIAYVGHARPHRHPHPSAALRLHGYRTAMRAAGLAPRVFASPEAAEATLDDAGQRPTAMVAYHDGTAARIMQTAYRRGLRIPTDLSLIAFNDDPEGGLLSPPLTTLAIPIQAIGRKAAEVVVTMLGGVALEDRVYRIAEDLRVRESTAPPG